MKLDWTALKTRSVADSPCGRFACIVCRDADRTNRPYRWSVHNQDDSGVYLVTDSDRGGNASTDSEARAACEAWLDEQDKPEWTRAKSGLASMAEWRGYTLVVRRCAENSSFFVGMALCTAPGRSATCGTKQTREDAERWCEQFVREFQTAPL